MLSGISGAALTLGDSMIDRSDKMTWKWKGWSELEDFGNPAGASGFRLCVADSDRKLVLSADIPAAGICSGRNCWRSTSSGYRYMDRINAHDGIGDMVLGASLSGSARIKVKGQGDSLAPFSLPIGLPASVRLMRSDATTCWDSRITLATRNDTSGFKGRAQ